MNIHLTPLAPSAPPYAQRVYVVLLRNSQRFDGRTDLMGEKCGAFIEGLRPWLSPTADGFNSLRSIGEQATALRVALIRGLYHMSDANTRTRPAVAGALSNLRALHEQVLQALEKEER